MSERGATPFMAMTACALLCAAAAASAQEDRPIGAGDLVYVKVHRQPELSTTTQVDANGNITLPYVGNVTVSGLSESEAAARVSSALLAILKNPRVTLTRSAARAASVETHAARTEEMSTQIIALRNSDAKVLQEALTGMSSAGGSVGFDPDSNTLILTDTPGALQNMIGVIRELDQMQTQATQVQIEAKIAEVESSAIKELGIRWYAVGDQLTGGYIPNARQDANVNAVRGFRDAAYNERIQDMTNNRTTVSGRRFLDESRLDRRLQVPIQVGAPGQMFLGYLNSGIDLAALIDALAADNQAELLAAPYIRTVNHKLAHIKMTDEVPYTELGSAGFNTISSTKFLDIGIILDVTPHVRKDPAGETYIRLELEPEVSTASGTSNGVPVRSVRSSRSVADAANRQTVVIGGIIQNEARDVRQRIPILGSIPGVGLLFSHKEKSKSARELMIFVTPTVYENPLEAPPSRSLNLKQASGGIDLMSSLSSPTEARKE